VAQASNPVSSVKCFLILVKRNLKITGLRYWMTRVLEECESVSTGFSADPVHDLRVSLRRCRSMADGLMAIDPDPDWKQMKKAGKRLFQSLGELRDLQIMMEWMEKLGLSQTTESADVKPEAVIPLSAANIVAIGDQTQAVASPDQALLEVLKRREAEQKQKAQAALEAFDHKHWRQWSKSLPLRAARIRPGSAVFRHLALERWTAAQQLHKRAMRSRSQIALHTLRIGIKRFRYIVENFLPKEHFAWSRDLKHVQDLLGEVHDLDVLWATASSCQIFHDVLSRSAWHERIANERAKRVNEYRQATVGADSLWNRWRAGLPQGRQIQEFATRRMKLWAKALDPDFAHSERVARISLDLYDALTGLGLLENAPKQGANAAKNGTNPREVLQIAALLHDVGKVKGKKGHHKVSRELIMAHGTPLGFNDETIHQAALVARFHTGALPVRSHKELRDLLLDEQKTIIRLSAILRLANALDSAHDAQIRRIRVENMGDHSRGRGNIGGFLRKRATLAPNEALVIAAEGYTPDPSTAQTIAAERYLLETVLGRAVIVKALKSAG
jgi:exopolyphosphatase/guanosine-5'-triphosphate,3'-diphosphate pyrophosphatase